MKTIAIEVSRKSKWYEFVSKWKANKIALGCTIVVVMFIVVASFPSFFATYNPDNIDVNNRFKEPSLTYLFGTDNFGRDIFSRTMYGLQISLQVGLTTALISSIIGLVIGLYAGYYRILDQLFMRISDGLIAFPSILLALAIMAMLGPSINNLIICLTIVITPSVARLVRSRVLVVKELMFIEAIKAVGANSTRIIWKHIAPNTLPTLFVQSTFIFVEVIIIEAALSFLGAGIPAPTPSLGNLLVDGKLFIFNSWWMTVLPGLVMFVLALSINLLGDALRDILDPHHKETK